MPTLSSPSTQQAVSRSPHVAQCAKGVGPPLLHWRCWGPIWFDPLCALLGGVPLDGISPRHDAIEHIALRVA
ncbi:MAG: hypothetical protein GY820_48500 [Gammaproteobacteria bacterium]|nr:hypothetical protein [Gammaproteobacteria bacterium]